MGIMNPLLIVYLLFIGSLALSSLNFGFINPVTAQVDNYDYNARITCASIRLGVRNPSVVKDEYGVGKLAVVSVNRSNNITASMEAGYMVFPERYGDNLTRFYIKWKKIAADGTIKGCFDLDCPGFIPRNGNRGFIGNRLVSGREGARPTAASSIALSIKLLNSGRYWALRRNNLVLGVWPDSLFRMDGNFPFNAVETGGDVELYGSTFKFVPDDDFLIQLNATNPTCHLANIHEPEGVYTLAGEGCWSNITIRSQG